MSEELVKEIDRIAHISDKFKQQQEFEKLFNSSPWKHAANEIANSYLIVKSL